MKKTIIVGAATAAALSLAGFALAYSIGSSAAAVAAHFDAKKVRSDTRTCLGSDGKTYQVSSGRYEGTATSANADLNGPVQINVRSVYNQTDRIGIVDGSIKWRAAGGDERRGYSAVSAILGDGGNNTLAVNGWASGRVLGNVTATYVPDGSVVGDLGAGNAITSKAVVLARLDCKRQETPSVTPSQPPRPAAKLEVKGEVDGILPNPQAPTQLSVKPRNGSASQVCTLKSGLSPSISGLVAKTSTTAGTRVEMTCGLVENVMTLLKIEQDD